ncbi:MAG: pyridoxamine 5'-phosphate oxidase family protein [Actinobacteria bacterium]|jgi:nitroimidazol reductase NimA-like FMN-containing flavoprotein (pyridoxamine 5'-phosphate oxidase superfamily)|nr:pyridoxamine 5'-phosphate oxidase family protein [Actinomycetota bacterium]
MLLANDLLIRTQGAIHVIDERNCIDLLKSVGVGRIGITLDALPIILPVNYIYMNLGPDLDGCILFRTDPGTKLDAAFRHSVVAFEVDQIDYDKEEGWSVLVIGSAEVVDDSILEDRAMTSGLHPWSGGMKTHMVAITPKIVSGRRITH